MKLEDIILTCIKEQPGINAKKVVSYLDSKINNLIVTEETNPQASIFKQLRTLKKKGILHNIGDR
ncbi:hypothetical protein [Niallia sp. FSL R7-0271]|uniref:hypothetical protein n=1 Tax=Niallia sp. FSL R7-0271 TaxID=2921678 RepID=UPI0030F50DD3